jgi:hypothetical protein
MPRSFDVSRTSQGSQFPLDICFFLYGEFADVQERPLMALEGIVLLTSRHRASQKAQVAHVLLPVLCRWSISSCLLMVHTTRIELAGLGGLADMET